MFCIHILISLYCFLSYFTLSPSHQETGKLLEQIREMNEQGITPQNIKDALTKQNSIVELGSIPSGEEAREEDDKLHQKLLDSTSRKSDTTAAASDTIQSRDEFSEVNSDVVNEI